MCNGELYGFAAREDEDVKQTGKKKTRQVNMINCDWIDNGHLNVGYIGV